MPGPWEKYAQQQAAPQATDGPWAKYAQNAPQDVTPEPQDERNGFQKMVDSATQRHDPNYAQMGPLSKALDNFGRGAAGAMLSPIAHPLDAINGAISAVSHPVDAAKGMAKSVRDEVQQNGAMSIPYALGNLGGGLIAGEAAGGLTKAAGLAAKSAGTGINNFILGTNGGDVMRGANPGRALATNRIWGSNPGTLLSGVDDAIPKAATGYRSDVARFTQPGQMINTGPLLSKPFDDLVAKATDPVTGAANPAQIAKAGKTQRTLAHVLDPQSGRITSDMRNPNLTPLQAVDLKSNIYGMTDYDNPSRAALANNGLKQAAHNLKSALDTAVPQARESGQNLHDLMSAKDILTPQAMGTRLTPATKAGLIDRATTAAGTGGAAALDAGGDLARILSKPLIPTVALPSALAAKRGKG